LESEPPEVYAILFIALAFSWGIVLACLALVALLICSALISGSEVAYFSLSPKEVHDLRAEASRSSQRIIALRSMPRRLLATILISNNFVNIAIVMVSNYVVWKSPAEQVFTQWAYVMHHWPLLSGLTPESIALGINFVLTVIAVTFLLVLFGEVAPKIYAKMNNVGFARLMSRPLKVLLHILQPLSRLLVSWSVGIERRLQSRNGSGYSTDKGDIDRAIDLAVSHDTDSKIEADILKGIIKFNDVAVKQVMRARVDVVAVDEETPYDELLKVVKSSGYSRIPVYRNDFDSISGILYIKDLIRYRHENASFKWQKLIRTPVLYVPESKKLNELLKEFQRERVHMGIVVDEYGGSAGLVTLEDVMEEVIGEIKDEFDIVRDGEYKKIDKRTFIFDGKMLINEACRIIDIDASTLEAFRGDADSLAGLILEINGEMPDKGEEFEVADLHFIILSVTKRRIEKIRIRIRGEE
jgi:putative hemolysin